MDAFFAESLNHLLTDLAQADSVSCQTRMRSNHTEHIAFSRIGIHSQEEVRRGEMEKTQGMGLQ
jgi:hypothetical protein